MASQEAAFQSPSQQSSLPTESAILLGGFWNKVSSEINEMNLSSFKTHELPLARIKKIMKLDEDVKMISAEAPVLFAKAAEIFISELSLRAWVHTEDNKRRTLQRNDIAMAISKFDQFDFLIDIVPREELKPAKRPDENPRTTSMMADQVQYYFQLAQQATGNLQQQGTQGAVQTTAAQPTVAQTTQVVSQPQQAQITTQALTNQLQVQAGQQILQQPFPLQLGQGGQLATQAQPQVIQVQAPIVGQQQQQQTQQQQQQLQLQQNQQVQQLQQATQVFQQVITPSGEVQNVPIQLTPQQFQAIQLQLQGKQSAQSVVIQSPQATQQPTEQTVQFTTQQSQQQPMFQIQQLPNGQQVYIQHTAQSVDGTEQQTDGQET